MPDERTIQAERDGHMLVAVTAHSFARTMTGLALGYELEDTTTANLDGAPSLTLVNAVRDRALLALVGTRRRVLDIVEEFHAVHIRTEDDVADGGQAARWAVLTSMLKEYDAEDAQLNGYRIGTAFARFESEYGHTAPVPPVPAAYEAHATEFEQEFNRARSEYDPSTACCPAPRQPCLPRT